MPPPDSTTVAHHYLSIHPAADLESRYDYNLGSPQQVLITPMNYVMFPFSITLTRSDSRTQTRHSSNPLQTQVTQQYFRLFSKSHKYERYNSQPRKQSAQKTTSPLPPTCNASSFYGTMQSTDWEISTPETIQATQPTRRTNPCTNCKTAHNKVSTIKSNLFG